MKIIYLHQHFRKPDEWGSTRPYYLSKAIAEAGHEVHLICGYNGKDKKEEVLEGVHIHYLPIPYRQEQSFMSRIFSFLKFAFKAYSESKKILSRKSQIVNRNSDTLVYASSTPLTVGLTALLLKRYQKLPYIFEVRDAWPEAPIEMGIVRNPLLIRLLHKFTRKIYKNAKSIVSLSPGITEIIKNYYVNTPIHEISNFSDTEQFKPLSKNKELTKKYLNDNEKGVIYFGAIGIANHLEYLLDIAEKSKGLPLKFFIVGDGSEKERLMQLAKQKGLENITFLPPVPKNELPQLLSIMDFSYVSFLNLPVLTSCSPNKLFDSLASGKVCITNTKGWMKDLLEKEECGFYADPENPQDFIDKIMPFLEDENVMQSHKGKARIIAENKYSETVMCGKLMELINS